jgi:hypothetical protein
MRIRKNPPIVPVSLTSPRTMYCIRTQDKSGVEESLMVIEGKMYSAKRWLRYFRSRGHLTARIVEIY